MITETLYETACADGIHSVVVMQRSVRSYSIQIIATDTRHPIGLARALHSEQSAIDYANRLAEGCVA